MGLGNPCPWNVSPPPLRETPYIPFCSSEDQTNNKKVRFNKNVQVIEIERVEPYLEKINNKFYIPSKSSNSEASPDLISHGQGQINPPSSNGDKQSIFKG